MRCLRVTPKNSLQSVTERMRDMSERMYPFIYLTREIVMDIYQEQKELELQYSRGYANQKVKQALTELYPNELRQYGQFIENLLLWNWEYEPKQQRLRDTYNLWIENEILPQEVFAEVIASVVFCDRSSLQALVGRIAHYMAGNYKEQCATAGEIVYLCTMSKLFSLSKETSTGMRIVHSNISLPDYVMNLIHRSAYMAPMLKPVKVRSNDNAGWVTTRQSVFLNDAHHGGNAPLEYLEILGSIPFSLDRHMLKYDEMDKWNPEYDPKQKEAAGVERDLTIRTMKDMLRRGNKFYFIHRFCARYRSYCSGYQLSTQGRDYKKAQINFSKEYVADQTYTF